MLPVEELILILAHSQTSNNSTSEFDKLNPLTAHDCSPPSSVPYAYLHEVKLAFKFSILHYISNTPAPKRQRLAFTSPYMPGSDMLFGAPGPVKHVGQVNQSHLKLDSLFQSQPWLPNIAVLDANVRYESKASFQEKHPRIDYFQNNLVVEPGRVATPRPKRPLHSNSTKSKDTMFTDMANLIDVGLRSMICDNIVQKPPNIMLLSDSGRPKLAEISPALFSPGYMQVRDFF